VFTVLSELVERLTVTGKKMVASGKGLLAMDERESALQKQ
jgi:fructose-bisphosphate aldolase class 1